jgi:hypothetical protein
MAHPIQKVSFYDADLWLDVEKTQYKLKPEGILEERLQDIGYLE